MRKLLRRTLQKKIFCLFISALLLLTACSNKNPKIKSLNGSENGQNEIKSNVSKNTTTKEENALIDLPEIISEAKKICCEKELSIDEFYTFAYGNRYVTVCGAVEQTDAQLLHEKYEDITFPDSIGDYKFQMASLDYKPASSMQVSNVIPDGVKLDSVYKQEDKTTYDHLLRMSISFYDEKKPLKIEVYRANAKAISVQESNLNVEEKIGQYEIVSDSTISGTYLRWGNETWKYLVHGNNGHIGKEFYKALVDADISAMIAFQ